MVTNCGAEVGSLSSWNVNNSVALYAQDEIFNSGIYGILATTLGTANPTTPVIMDQYINTTPGQIYTLSFYHAVGSGNLNSFAVNWNGENLSYFVNENSHDFTLITYHNLLATSNMTLLQFEFVNRADDSFIDDISLVAVPVPEPMTWLSLGSSLGIITLLRSRGLIQRS